MVALAVRAVGSRRALYLAVATGTVYGFTAILTKSTVDLFDGGIVEVLGHWQLYALLAVSAVGLLLNQSAFQAGHVAASLPAIAVTNPVLSCIFAVTMFGEHLDAHGPLPVTVTVLSIAAMAGGTIALRALATRDARGAKRPRVGCPGSQLSDRWWRSETPAGRVSRLAVERPMVEERNARESGIPARS